MFDEIATGKPLALVKAEHTEAVQSDQVWGVPTFIVDGQSAFVRLMDRPEGDSAVGRRHRRAGARPADLAGAQRVQAHEHPPLTVSR